MAVQQTDFAPKKREETNNNENIFAKMSKAMAVWDFKNGSGHNFWQRRLESTW